MRQDKLDLIIEGGWVIDGLGGPRVRADVGVADGRIAALGDLSGYIADRRLDAAGRIVAPGFIDVHGHDDLMFVEKPDLAWKTSQGITSVVVGNCGISGAPAAGQSRGGAGPAGRVAAVRRHGCVLRHVAGAAADDQRGGAGRPRQPAAGGHARSVGPAHGR